MRKQSISLLLMILCLSMMTISVNAQRNYPTNEPTSEPRDSANASVTEAPQSTPSPAASDSETDTDAPTTPDSDTNAIVIQAEDGLQLAGHYYGNGSRAVLLLHELYTASASWNGVIDALLDSGFSVLTVDLRGHGATRGAINWNLAQDDTLTWLDWLTDAQNVRRVYVMGSSMGANLAMVGCAAHDACVGAVAISPGLHYFGVFTEDAVLSGLPMLLVYADRDSRPARDIPQMIDMAEDAELDTLTVLSYPGRAHGMLLFDTDAPVLEDIVAWLRGIR